MIKLMKEDTRSLDSSSYQSQTNLSNPLSTSSVPGFFLKVPSPEHGASTRTFLGCLRDTAVGTFQQER